MNKIMNECVMTTKNSIHNIKYLWPLLKKKSDDISIASYNIIHVNLPDIGKFW